MGTLRSGEQVSTVGGARGKSQTNKKCNTGLWVEGCILGSKTYPNQAKAPKEDTEQGSQ